MKSIQIAYRDALKQPEEVGRKMGEFLEIPLDVQAMTLQVDASLYRNRKN